MKKTHNGNITICCGEELGNVTLVRFYVSPGYSQVFLDRMDKLVSSSKDSLVKVSHWAPRKDRHILLQVNILSGFTSSLSLCKNSASHYE